jgi:hypothetical protein
MQYRRSSAVVGVGVCAYYRRANLVCGAQMSKAIELILKGAIAAFAFVYALDWLGLLQAFALVWLVIAAVFVWAVINKMLSFK